MTTPLTTTLWITLTFLTAYLLHRWSKSKDNDIHTEHMDTGSDSVLPEHFGYGSHLSDMEKRLRA